MIELLDQLEIASVYGGGSGDEKGDEPRFFNPGWPTLAADGSGDEKGDEP